MMDKIYYKSQEGTLWQKSPHMAFAILILAGMAVYFWFVFYVCGWLRLNTVWSTVVSFLIFIVLIVVLAIKYNQRHNMSKSTAFVKRDGKLYAIQLLYTRQDIGLKETDEVYYGDSGGTLNFDIADNVMKLEDEVRSRREKIEEFSAALDDILCYLEEKPKKYSLRPDSKRSKMDRWFYNAENNGLASIATKRANYNFAILNEPKIEKETDKYFIVRFLNEQKEPCTAKFTNCYGDIIKDINANQTQ